jgi:cysteine desulfurase
MRIYLDNAATTAMRTEVIDAMSTCMKDFFGNPSSIHADGRKVRNAIEEARKKIANLLGASIGEIFFTSGGTESSNMAIKCAVRDLGVQRIITSQLEHHCVLHAAENVGKHNNIQVDYVQIDEKGRIDYTDLERLLISSDQKTLVSLMHANNEIGTLLDMQRVSDLCVEHGAYFHSDTVQTVGHIPIDLTKVKLSFFSGAAHKFHGPKGVGFIYISGYNPIKPFVDGGAQERNMRGGTENVYGIVGMAKALDLAYENMDEYRNHIESVRDYLKTQLETHFDDIAYNGDFDGNYLYTVLSVNFPPSPKAEMLLMSLDIYGISASGGSACTSGSEGGSHVITAIGGAVDRKTIRFSFSHYNTNADIDILIEKLKMIIPSKALA